jgi:hypothetical protein
MVQFFFLSILGTKFRSAKGRISKSEFEEISGNLFQE